MKKDVSVRGVGFQVLNLEQISARCVEATVMHERKHQVTIRHGTGGFMYARDFDYERASQAAIEVAADRCLSGKAE